MISRPALGHRWHLGAARALLPQPARERLQEWHPTRARRWRTYPGVERVAGRRVALTFDDGPDDDATPAVLEALDAVGATATFFMLGSQVEARPELALEVARRGHQIALHGYGHRRHDRITEAESRDDLTRGRAAIEDALGVSPVWFRPPYGKMSSAAARVCQELRMTTAYWSTWGLDWEPRPAAVIARRVARDLGAGTIVLLHDSARFARRASALPTAEAVPLIAALAQRRELVLGSLGETASLPAGAAA